MASPNWRVPDPLRVNGSNLADDWSRFKEQFANYELASDLTGSSQEKRAAVFLTCIGNDAYDVYRALQFDSADARKQIDTVIAAFEKFCVGAVNETYERYVFNRRVQENGERFDVFVGEIRRLARTCNFSAVGDSLIRDRIVVGIREDSTRHKLLQVRDLTLVKAIDICKASEAASEQLKAMSGADQVQALHSSSRGLTRSKPRAREAQDASLNRHERNRLITCKYCNRKHEFGREACPAYGQFCRRCQKKNHFESVCQSMAARSSKKNARHDVNEIDENETDEELMTLGGVPVDRWYTKLNVDGHTVRFLLDCGATVNLIPESVVRSLGRLDDMRPAVSALRMFDKSQLQTSGMIKLVVKHPRTSRIYDLEFYVAAKHEQALLGFTACQKQWSICRGGRGGLTPL